MITLKQMDVIQFVKRALEKILELTKPDCSYCEAIATAASDALDAIERAQEDPLPF